MSNFWADTLRMAISVIIMIWYGNSQYKRGYKQGQKDRD